MSGPVSIATAGSTRFVATKRIVLDGTGVHHYPAVCRALTETHTQSIGTCLPGLRGNIARNIAGRRLAEDRPQINAESARHAEERICRAMDQRVAVVTSRLHKSFAPVLAAVGRSGDKRLPSRMVCRSTAGGLHITLCTETSRTETPRTEPSGVAVAPSRFASEADRPGSFASVRIYAPLVKLMLADISLRDVIKPLARSFKGAPRPQLAKLVPAGSLRREISWATQRDWVTIRWSAIAPHTAAATAPAAQSSTGQLAAQTAQVAVKTAAVETRLAADSSPSK